MGSTPIISKENKKMKVIIYDAKPGSGFGQWLLMMSWAIGSKLQKLFGFVDDVYGAESWTAAGLWLKDRSTEYSQIQYWGHGSPGNVWLNGRTMDWDFFLPIKNKLTRNSLIWFRTCSTFQGKRGHMLATHLANSLNCVVAGHTRVIGLLQGGLHTLAPMNLPSWPLEEGEPKSKIPSYLLWGPNTITCFQTKIPEGW